MADTSAPSDINRPVSTGESTELVVAGIGELVDLRSEQECIRALAAVRDLEQQLREAKGALTDAIRERSAHLGTKTFHVGSLTAEVKGGSETMYDAEKVEEGLRAVGAPEELIREIVQETVSYRVDAMRAKRAAAANPAYAQVIEQYRRVVEKPASISIRRG
jgi:hypothetical protein